MTVCRTFLIFTFITFGLAAVVQAAESPAKLEIGAQAPTWSNLPGVDGKQHGLQDLKDAKAVVVVFTCNSCPVAQAYEDRIKQFVSDYKDKGVALVAIHVSKAESLEDAKARAEESGFSFAYLHDADGTVAKAYAAKTSPHVFLLDGKRHLAYQGAIDDNMIESKVTRHYLRDATDAVLAGEAPPTTETRPVGCAIRY